MEKKYRALARFTHKIKTTYLKHIKPEQFIKILRKKEVDIVVDIRYWSVYPIYFTPVNMRLLLGKNDIDYLRLQKLGNPKVLRQRAGENFELAKELYLKYIINDPEAREQLFFLFKLLRFKKNYCLICYCPTLDVKLCHRFWLKEMLVNLKRKVLGLSTDYIIENFTNQLIPEVIT